jgi:hypothetical protein
MQVWHDNTVAITCAVFTFTRVELLGFLELAEIEASPPEEIQGDAQGSTPQQLTQALTLNPRPQESAEQEDLNWSTRNHLSWIERCAFAVRVTREISAEDRANTIESLKRLPDWREHGPKHFEKYSCFQDPPNYVRFFLMLRRFVVGYDHPSLLPSTYADLHNLSWDDMDHAHDVARIIEDEDKCEQHWDHIGIQRTDGEWPDWRFYYSADDSITHLPRHWSFAAHIMTSECIWRPELPNVISGPKHDDEVEEAFSLMCEHLGKDRIKLMVGSDSIPWTEERCLAREHRFWTAEAQAKYRS